MKKRRVQEVFHDRVVADIARITDNDVVSNAHVDAQDAVGAHDRTCADTPLAGRARAQQALPGGRAVHLPREFADGDGRAARLGGAGDRWVPSLRCCPPVN